MIVCLLCMLFGGTTLSASAASHQACLPTVQGPITTPPAQAGTVLINEVLLSSKQTWSCPGSTSVPGSEDNSWIELYNPMALSFNLYIVHAEIDGGPGTTPILFPFGSAIAAHGFLAFFPYKRTLFPNGVETFTRRLLFNNGPVSTVINQITIPSNFGDGQSYARIPMGVLNGRLPTLQPLAAVTSSLYRLLKRYVLLKQLRQRKKVAVAKFPSHLVRLHRHI